MAANLEANRKEPALNNLRDLHDIWRNQLSLHHVFYAKNADLPEKPVCLLQLLN
jgi:hypothetical protein